MDKSELIEQGFLALVKTVPGLNDALDHEPQSLPRAYPVLTMLFVGAPQNDVATGLVEITWHWKVNLYVSLMDYRKAQLEMKRLVPLVLKLTRQDPYLGNSCEWAEITDEEEEPIFSTDDKFMLKRLDLRAKTTET